MDIIIIISIATCIGIGLGLFMRKKDGVYKIYSK